MRHILRRMCAVLLLIALLSTGMIAARADGANGAENTLEFALYYDQKADKLLEDPVTLAILASIDGQNVVFTDLPPQESLITAFIAADGTINGSSYMGVWCDNFHLYAASSSLGKAQGFYSVGVMTKDEPLKYVTFGEKNGKTVRTTVSTTATALKDGKVTLKNTPNGSLFPLPVLNSKNEVCALIDKTGCYAIITDEETFYGGDQPAEERPAETQPPATQPSGETPAEEQSKVINKAGDLPDLDELYKNASKKEDDSNLGILAIAGVCVLVVILAAAVVLVKRKNAKIAEQNSNTLNEAEEGTQLADDFVDTGLRLQFRSGKRVAVRQNFTIGRAPDNGVVIPQQSTGVSGHHCAIVLQDGRAFLRDMGSTNGTFVNGRRIAAGQLVPLQPGMRVSLGGVNSPECFDVVLSSKLTGEK